MAMTVATLSAPTSVCSRADPEFRTVADPSLMPARDVYRFALQSRDLSLATYYQREQALLSQQTATQIGQEGLSDCVAGQPVEGLELTAVGGGAFQKNWFAVRNGSLYDIGFVAASMPTSQPWRGYWRPGDGPADRLRVRPVTGRSWCRLLQ